MAEPVSLIASIIGLVTAGKTFSECIYTLSETIDSARADLTSIADDIKVFCSVLNHLRSILKRRKCPKEFLKDIEVIVGKCKRVFSQINTIVGKMQKRCNSEKVDIVTGCKWHYKKSEVQKLKVSLESLKTTLQLMLMVLLVARSYPKRLFP
jgi:hypothetical protein